MNPQIQLIVSIGLIVLGLFGPKIYELIKTYVPNPLNLLNKSTTSDDLGSYSIHEILGHLLGRYKAEKDEEAIVLVSALGKHAYDIKVTNEQL